MSRPTLITQRIRLVPMKPEHLPHLVELDSDPEVLRFILDFATVGLSTVWAETMAVNQPSRRVMAKLGMRHVRTDHRSWDNPLPGAEQGEVVYEVARDEWLSRRGSSREFRTPAF